MTTPNDHPWSVEALFTKSLLYVGEMERHTADDWRYAFWASLNLELLARAAVAHISPTLLADRKDRRNIQYALGQPITKIGFKPTSVSTNEVFMILSETVQAFPKELLDFCIDHSGRRNAELHSGEQKFSTLGNAQWLPRYYTTCRVLLESMGRSLSDLFEDAKVAEELIASFQDEAAKIVNRDISKHREAWKARDDNDRAFAQTQAETWATRQAGHRVICPACSSSSLVFGSGKGAVSTEFEEGDDLVIQRQTMIPSAFECIACGLKISGFSKLLACGLGDAFTATSTFSPAEFFGLYTEDELNDARSEGPRFDDDFNEY